MNTSRFALLLIPAVFAACVPAPAATIRVPGDQPTIQAGLNAASIGDTVLVACGTYYEHDIDMTSAVTLRSETGDPDCVVIDADRMGRVFVCLYEGPGTAIEGVTITGGWAMGGGDESCGAGVLCDHAALTFRRVRFADNAAGYLGAGMYCTNSATPVIDRCEFVGNDGGTGGGLACELSSEPTITDCVFSGNWAGTGAGLYCRESSPTLENVAFLNNRAWATSDYNGGGVTLSTGSCPSLTNVTLAGNTAYLGGAMYCWGNSNPHLVNVTIVGNSAMVGGGGIHSADSAPELENTIVAFNSGGAPITCSGTGAALLTCSDVYGNSGGDWVGCIADQHGLSGNFSEDPLFCLEENPGGPYSLHEGSPCLLENSPCGELVGAFGEGCGPISPVEDASWGAIKAMYR